MLKNLIIFFSFLSSLNSLEFKFCDLDMLNLGIKFFNVYNKKLKWEVGKFETYDCSFINDY